MSYISADEQSEDGELRQSPEAPRQKEEIMDFSLSEEDGENVDSLEIKPPQASISAQSRGSKRRVAGESRSSSTRHKTRSERHHQHSSSSRGGGGGGGAGEERRSSHHRSEKHHSSSRAESRSDKQNGGTTGSSSRSNKERGEQHYQREKERYYREKQNYEQHMQQQQQQQQQQQEQQHGNYSEVQYVNERAYRERKDETTTGGTRKRHTESSASRKHDDKKPKEVRSVIENPNRETSDSNKQHRRYEDEKRDRADRTLQDLRERLLSKRTTSKSDDVSSTERTSESRSRDTKKRHRRGERSGVLGDGVVETLDAALQGEAGMFVKEIINISTGEDKKHRRVEDMRIKDEDKLTDEEKAQQEIRKEKLLEAEREMARVKEHSRAERERRHLEKVIHNKRKQLEEEEDFYNKRMRSVVVEESNVVTVSDNTDDEEDDRKVDDNRKNKRYEEDEEEEDEDEEEEDEEEEEEDDDDDNKSERSEDSARTSSNDSRCSNRSDRSSESRDRSASSERRSRSRSPSTERSRSVSPSNRDMTRDNSQERQIAEEKDKKKEESAPEPPNLQNLPPYYPAVQGCRSVEEFQCLNRIEEGTYGVVYRAKDKRTGAIVALKRLKMEKEKEGFPITSLREINTLLKAQHSNIVTVQEIVVGSNMDKIFIVMDYVEHDLKSLMETMRHKRQTFKPGEVKCLLIQLLKAVAHLHDNWILHRDLKTSNLLFSHQGILKVGDFGLAREYGSPLKPYTPIVVTLWYRAPELLLCAKEYSTPIDMWSVGCIFAELLLMNALFPGKSEVDQVNRIFKELGTPNEKVWPGFNKLPAVQKMKFGDYPTSNLRAKFHMLSELGLGLLLKFLTFDPSKRITAEKALDESFFEEAPRPINPNMFPTWPAKSELGQKRALAASPKPPSGGGEYKKLGGDGDGDADDDGYGFRIGMGIDPRRMGGGFSLKF